MTPGPVSDSYPGSTRSRRRSIEQLRELQDREGLRDRHLIEFDSRGFTIAHTDAERATAARGGPSLGQCPIHEWALALGRSEPTGVYTLRRGLGALHYELEPLQVS